MLDQVKRILEQTGNPYAVIRTDSKIKYHAAAAVVSNLYVGLAELGLNLLCECGFQYDEAKTALGPLMKNNTHNIAEAGPVNALTGPIERNDVETVAAHLSCLNDEQSLIYRSLSREVVKIAKKRNPDRDYTKMEEML